MCRDEITLLVKFTEELFRFDDVASFEAFSEPGVDRIEHVASFPVAPLSTIQS